MKGHTMDTNGRFKAADHKACNGKPIAAGDTPKSAVQSRGVGRKTLWGTSMVMVALFRFLMTWAIGVPPEPVNVLITAIFGAVGIVFFTWGRREQAGTKS